MNFTPALAELILSGEKTQTRRALSSNPRSPWFEGGCKLRVGQDYAICPGRGKHQVARVRVTAVDKITLRPIPPDDARAEGFDSPEAFYAAWEEINGREPDFSTFVWRVTFERQESR